MVKRTRKTHKSRTPKQASMLNQELVVIVTAEAMDEAKEYELLLKNNDIPAMIKKQQDEFTDVIRYAILVPEEVADEANVIIESQDAYDDFYDSEIDDTTEEDLEGDVFED